MKIIGLILSTIIILSTPVFAQHKRPLNLTHRGILLGKKAPYFFLTPSAKWKLDFRNSSINKYLSSLVDFDTLLEFKTSVKVLNNNILIPLQTPTIYSGLTTITGVLTQENDQYYIGKTPVSFKILTDKDNVLGSRFNRKSSDSFLGQQVQALVNKDAEKGYIISAIIPANLYTSEVPPANSPTSFNETIEFIENEFVNNKYSQSMIHQKGVIFSDQEKQVKPGTTALIVTLSGRQGDDLNENGGASGGHFAIGEAIVQQNGHLKAEIYNFYPRKNSKQIIPGHVSIEDYYGGLVAGQNNYRPTYTLIIYGIALDKIKKARKFLDSKFSELRNFSEASLWHNCTNTLMDALVHAQIYGDQGIEVGQVVNSVKPIYDELLKKASGRIDEPTKLFLDQMLAKIINLNGEQLLATIKKYEPLALKHMDQATFDNLAYALTHNPAYFIPRNAFFSYVRNVASMNAIRADFIFQAQTPSDRNLGGISTKGIVDNFILISKYKEAKKQAGGQLSLSQIQAILDTVQ